MSKHIRGALLVFVALFMVSMVCADVSVSKGLFSKGKSRGTLYGTTAGSFDETYFVLGLGYGYYVLNGLQLGLDAESWLGANPNVYKVTPQAIYVADFGKPIFPYVGGFYRRTFVEDFDDLDSYGGRVGAYFLMGSNVYTGIGYVFEQYTGCEESVYTDCSTSYPEFNISVAF